MPLWYINQLASNRRTNKPCVTNWCIEQSVSGRQTQGSQYFLLHRARSSHLLLRRDIQEFDGKTDFIKIACRLPLHPRRRYRFIQRIYFHHIPFLCSLCPSNTVSQAELVCAIKRLQIYHFTTIMLNYIAFFLSKYRNYTVCIVDIAFKFQF